MSTTTTGGRSPDDPSSSRWPYGPNREDARGIDDMTEATARIHEQVGTAWKLGAGDRADRPAAEPVAARIARLDDRTETTAADL